MKKFYITTPIYYVNDKPHIGHLYTNIVTDVIARFKRLDGYNVLFSTGTDEHGQKVEQAAKKKNTLSQNFVNNISKKFINFSNDFNISNNIFIRTSDKKHKNFVKNFWFDLIKRKQIYRGKYKGWYSIRDESYIHDHEIIHNKTTHYSDIEWLEENCYFFKLSNWRDKLLKFYKKNPYFIKPEKRKNEVVSLIKSGLKDLCISRSSFRWGINVPKHEKHILYVWFEALLNYLSLIEKNNITWPVNLHIIGKDILKFHAIYWPAILMASKLKLPKAIFAHGWWLKNGKKISKSTGNIIDPYEIKNSYSSDYCRYYFIKEINFGNDGNFSNCSFINRINYEFVNKVGNLIYRFSTLIANKYRSLIPKPIQFEEQDKLLLIRCYAITDIIRGLIDKYELKKALDLIIDLTTLANIFINNNKPWQNNNLTRIKNSLYVISEVTRVISILLQPFTPELATQVLDYFCITKRNFNVINTQHSIKTEKKIKKPEIFFKKIL